MMKHHLHSTLIKYKVDKVLKKYVGKTDLHSTLIKYKAVYINSTEAVHLIYIPL